MSFLIGLAIVVGIIFIALFYEIIAGIIGIIIGMAIVLAVIGVAISLIIEGNAFFAGLGWAILIFISLILYVMFANHDSKE